MDLGTIAITLFTVCSWTYVRQVNNAYGGSWKDGGYPCYSINNGKHVLTISGGEPTSRAYGFVSSTKEGTPYNHDFYECICLGKASLIL